MTALPLGDHFVAIDFPGDIEYIPDIRRFISNIIALRDFSRRFTFRTEIIIDELCNNAIKFGRLKLGEFITLSCTLRDSGVVIEVFNPGADDQELANLHQPGSRFRGRRRRCGRPRNPHHQNPQHPH